MSDRGVILAVDDEPYNLILIEGALTDFDYEVVLARGGAEAWEILERDPRRFDAVLLDRMMPNMSGMEVLAKVRAHPQMRFLPVILQTAAVDNQSVIEGIRAGAYYYLTKPFSEEMLVAVVQTAVDDGRGHRYLHSQLESASSSLTFMKSAEFGINTLAAAKELARSLSKCCPRPQMSVIGLAELLVNAHEHGNLGIGYKQKSALIDAGRWQEEILKREELPENREKEVRVSFQRSENGVRISIQDQGEGFDWKQFMSVSLERAFDTHGRGIAIARTMCFCSISYNSTGNSVVVEINADKNEE